MGAMMFWNIIKDTRINKFQVIGTSNDDRDLINEVVNMQKQGMYINCETIPITYSEENILKEYKNRLNYTEDKGLYEKLKNEYYDKTKK